jgi:hypothetical protein
MRARHSVLLETLQRAVLYPLLTTNDRGMRCLNNNVISLPFLPDLALLFIHALSPTITPFPLITLSPKP